MAKSRRVRKKGPGRPPAGPIAGKVSIFSTRITAQTRGALETEARASGQSISQTAERLIRIGLAQIREQQTVAPTRALRFLLGQLADDCSIKPGIKRFEWYEDRFSFDAFRLAVQMFLEPLRPTQSNLETQLNEGSLPSPDMWRGILGSPEELARSVVLGLWGHLERVQPTTSAQAMSLQRRVRDLADMDEADAIVWSRYTYTLEDVRRDLDLHFGEKKS
jgi:hypothetical protein